MNENDLYKDATPLKERAKNETVAYHLKPDVPWDLIWFKHRRVCPNVHCYPLE